MQDYFNEISCLNLMIDIPINYYSSPLEELPCYISGDKLVNASLKEHLYGIFPCKGNKCIVFYYNYGKLTKTAMCDDKGTLMEFNNYGLKTTETIEELPPLVEEMCIMQLQELKQGDITFKLWVHGYSEVEKDVYVEDYMTVTNFRISMLMRDIIGSNQLNTITNDQNRLPNAGVVYENKWNSIIDYYKDQTRTKKLEQIKLF